LDFFEKKQMVPQCSYQFVVPFTHIRLIWSSRSAEDRQFAKLWSKKQLPVAPPISSSVLPRIPGLLGTYFDALPATYRPFSPNMYLLSDASTVFLAPPNIQILFHISCQVLLKESSGGLLGPCSEQRQSCLP
jgi:hypothetical protein